MAENTEQQAYWRVRLEHMDGEADYKTVWGTEQNAKEFACFRWNMVYEPDNSAITAVLATEEEVSEATKLPSGYTIGTDGEYQPGKFKYIVIRPEGTRVDPVAWHMDADGAIKDAWGDYYGRIAEAYNAERENEEDHVLAWMVKGTEEVYAADHLDHEVLPENLIEVTISSHGTYPSESRYYIANLLCTHCGCAAVDDEILSEHGLLLNEEFEEDDEEEWVAGSIEE